MLDVNVIDTPPTKTPKKYDDDRFKSIALQNNPSTNIFTNTNFSRFIL